jgi:hypothetical protein
MLQSLLPVVLRGVFESFAFVYLGRLSCSLFLFWILFMELAFALQENPCRWFPREVVAFLLLLVLQHLRCCPLCRHPVRSRSPACQPAVLTGSPTRAPLGSVGLQATKNLLLD